MEIILSVHQDTGSITGSKNRKGRYGMQTIIIRLFPEKLENADLDLRYYIPERIEEITDGMVQDNGYDYLEENTLALWLQTEDAISAYPAIVKLFREESFMGNDLSLSAELYISEERIRTSWKTAGLSIHNKRENVMSDITYERK